ncbi:hypothetical protein IAE30_27580 [Pantoea sp. S61]|uniref:hypothetical protein n=1 Tax=Pantoea sp. S61 TaxID=2767442 RepID=UPI00190A75B7|nr:hypothetical protein [Pantoea sp. S61]MBK0127505.1 hypothetical protein [Pantoea sp. S61]
MPKRFACVVLCSLLTACSETGHPPLIWFSVAYLVPALITLIAGRIFFSRKMLTANVLIITLMNTLGFYVYPAEPEPSFRLISMGVFSMYFAMIGPGLSYDISNGQPRFGFVGRTLAGCVTPFLCVGLLWWVLLTG